MKGLIRIVLASVTLSIMSGCVEWLNHTNYQVLCSVDKSLRVDSISLMLLEEQYDKIKLVEAIGADSVSGAFLFEGQIEQPCVAFLKFSNDTTPFYFVLEQGETVVNIGTRGIVITGGELNHEYFDFLKQRHRILSARNDLRSQYLRMAAPDSIVNIASERELAMRDSLLVDSLDVITVNLINRGGPVSKIVFDRFVNSLSHNNLLKINKQ